MVKNNDLGWREIAAAVTNDGIVENDEILILYKWLTQKNTVFSKPLIDLKALIEQICADGVVTSAERTELLQFLHGLADHLVPTEKGTLFEEFIVDLFPDKEFELIEWRSDKQASGNRWPTSCQWPDLELQQRATGKRLAVECKYRARPDQDSFEWAKPWQPAKYREYQYQKGFPVYVAIGTSGHASSPENLFFVPLDCLETSVARVKDLERFRVRERSIADCL